MLQKSVLIHLHLIQNFLAHAVVKALKLKCSHISPIRKSFHSLKINERYS